MTDIDDHLEAIKDVTMDRGLQRTILKRGDKGAMLYDRTSGWVAEPAHHARAVDTCGAGDAFMAAFIIREMIGSPLHMCLDKANLWASKSIETVGTVVPSKEEAERWW